MITEISQMINGVKMTIDGISFLSSVNKQFNKAEADLRFADIAKQMISLTQQLSELQRILAVRVAVTQVDGVFWKNEEVHSGVPFCPKCHDRDKLYQMQEFETKPTSFSEGFVYWQCTVCSHTVARTDKPRTPKVAGYFGVGQRFPNQF